MELLKRHFEQQYKDTIESIKKLNNEIDKIKFELKQINGNDFKSNEQYYVSLIEPLINNLYHKITECVVLNRQLKTINIYIKTINKFIEYNDDDLQPYQKTLKINKSLNDDKYYNIREIERIKNLLISDELKINNTEIYDSIYANVRKMEHSQHFINDIFNVINEINKHDKQIETLENIIIKH